MEIFFIIVLVSLVTYYGYNTFSRSNERHQFSSLRISGVSYDNEDGSSRQLIISMLSEGDPITLKHEFNNPYDRNAIAVLTSKGQKIGHIPKTLNGEVLRLLQNGKIMSAEIQEIYRHEIQGVVISLELKGGSI